MNRSKALGSSRSINGKPVIDVLRAVLFGAVAGAVICAALLAAFSMAFVSMENIPQGFLTPLIVGVSVLSSFFSGFIAAKISGKRGLIFGLLAGLLLFFLFLVSGLATENQSSPDTAGTRLLIMAASGAVGGLLAVSRRSRRK